MKNIKKIIGIHDHKNTESEWLKEETNYSWINVLKKESEYEKLFLLRSDADKKINKKGLTYRLYASDLDKMVNEAAAFEPDTVFLNICYFEKAAIFINELLKIASPRIIIRIHHDFRYLVCLPHFLNFVKFGDAVITPSSEQSLFSRSYLSPFTNI